MTPQTHWIGGSYEAACGGKSKPSALPDRVLQLLRQKPGLPTSAIALELHSPVSTMYATIGRLEAAGDVYKITAKQFLQIGATHINHWFLTTHDKKQPRCDSRVPSESV